MYYVVAHDHYYPCGGFRDIKFKGSWDDCEQVKQVLEERYDVVRIEDGFVSTRLPDWLPNT